MDKKFLPAVAIGIALLIGMSSIFFLFQMEQTEDKTQDEKEDKNDDIYIGQRKALICCSANDFYGSGEDDDFNNGNDSNLEKPGASSLGNWTYVINDGATDIYHGDGIGHPNSPTGSLLMDVTGVGPSVMNE
ncbi:MAG: hypothetical protein ACTSR8_05745 [Promethearchaeota archaeon]